MCEYCYQSKDNEISGKPIFQYEWKETAGYEPPKDRNDFLEMFILKLKNDKKAGLMIDSGYGYRYIDINYCPMCRKEAYMNIDNNNPINNIIRYTIVFYEEEAKPNTWGSNNIIYEICYDTKDGIMQVHEIGAFGDSTLVAMYQDRRGRGITLKEMLENIEEISNMTYKEFQEKIVGRRLGE